MKTVQIISEIAVIAIFLTAGLSMYLVADAYVLTTGEMENFLGGEECNSRCKEEGGEDCAKCFKIATNQSKQYDSKQGKALHCVGSKNANDYCDMSGIMNCGTLLDLKYWFYNENCNGVPDHVDHNQPHSIADASGDPC